MTFVFQHDSSWMRLEDKGWGLMRKENPETEQGVGGYIRSFQKFAM